MAKGTNGKGKKSTNKNLTDAAKFHREIGKQIATQMKGLKNLVNQVGTLAKNWNKVTLSPT